MPQEKKQLHKVVAYITCGSKLLVYTHRDFPAVGVQVPAGTIDAGETPQAAVLREAFEETGLKDLKIVSALGQEDYDISILRPEIHTRHFFHLEVAPPVPEKWLHFEKHPSGGDLKEIAFNLFWVDPAEIGKKEPELFLGFGARLHRLKVPKPNKAYDPPSPAL